EEHDPLWDRPDGMLWAAREVLDWSEDQVWGRWTGPQADAARQWRATARPAHVVAALALAGLDPEQTGRLTTPVVAGGAGLTEPEAVKWRQAVGGETAHEAVQAIIAWRLLGLPAEPPDTVWTLSEMEPSEAALWLARGFTFEEMSLLHG